MAKDQVSASATTEATTDTGSDSADWMPTPDEVAEVRDAEVVVARRFSTEELTNITSFDEAMKAAAQAFGGMVDSTVLGDGFTILDKKDKLVNVPFVILEWEHGKNVTMGEKFVIVRLVTEANHKYIITDGSTGIMRQLETMLGNRRGGIFCREGLRASTYGLNENNEPVELNSADAKSTGTTYYIA